MIEPRKIEAALGRIKDQKSFLQELLADTLGWPVIEGAGTVEEVSFEWSAEELRASGLDKHLVDSRIWQLQRFQDEQPWGIFIIEFKKEDAFAKGRGLTGPLRKILRGLVPKARRRSDLPAWKRENLLFICTHQYQHYRFAYFKAPKNSQIAPLATFGWQQGDSFIRTLCECNLKELEWQDTPTVQKTWTQNWQKAFDIEKVTNRFYDDYAKVFEATEKLIHKNTGFSGQKLRLYTQTLFNRLMFLRFIERKGWLELGGRKDYLQALADAGPIGKKSLYQSRIKPLFFEGLAIEGHQKIDCIGKVPFLNGGLFEVIKGLDDEVKDLGDEVFLPIIGKDGLFYRYNFTVEESTPLDVDVAVDPEMLGKVFEELVTGRHETGSYYTPRPIVAFMCREAIKGYLGGKTSATKEAIEKLVDEHEIAKDLTERHAGEILFYLDTVKAVDPACGSGAYLLGLLQELIEIRRTLQNEKLKGDPQFIYNLKLKLISHSLYGVDIDPFATNIAKLRLWLSLAVEAENPEPLPNLDFKIETGDALLGPCDPSANINPAEGGALMAAALRKRAEGLILKKDEYLVAHGDRKNQLYLNIKEEEQAIAKDSRTLFGENVIAWTVHFAEVFVSSRRTESTMFGEFGFMADAKNQKAFKLTSYEPGGFDIVLANPPYVRQELIKDIKPLLKQIFPKVFTGTADLYTYFYARAIEMLSPGGMIVFISSNKWFRADYGNKIRKYIANNCIIHSITDFGELPVFKTAATFPMIFIAQKHKGKSQPIFTQVKNLFSPYPDVKAITKTTGQILPSHAIQDEKWNMSDSKTLDLLYNMKKAGPPLKEYVKGEIYYGIKTGFNEAFVIDRNVREKLIADDPASADLIKPMCKGDDVRKWHIRDKDRWIIVTRIGVEIAAYPAIFNHLKKWEKQLKTRQDQGNHWWELRACTYYDIFDKSKIVYPEIAREARFALDKNCYYPIKTVFSIPSNDCYLLGVLNSHLAWEYLKHTCSVLGDADKGGRLTLQATFVEMLPIPQASDQDKKIITKLVQKCLDAKGVGCEAWEKEIDERVEALYGL